MTVSVKSSQTFFLNNRLSFRRRLDKSYGEPCLIGDKVFCCQFVPIYLINWASFSSVDENDRSWEGVYQAAIEDGGVYNCAFHVPVESEPSYQYTRRCGVLHCSQNTEVVIVSFQTHFFSLFSNSAILFSAIPHHCAGWTHMYWSNLIINQWRDYPDHRKGNFGSYCLVQPWQGLRQLVQITEAEVNGKILIVSVVVVNLAANRFPPAYSKLSFIQLLTENS